MINKKPTIEVMDSTRADTNQSQRRSRSRVDHNRQDPHSSSPTAGVNARGPQHLLAVSSQSGSPFSSPTRNMSNKLLYVAKRTEQERNFLKNVLMSLAVLHGDLIELQRMYNPVAKAMDQPFDNRIPRISAETGINIELIQLMGEGVQEMIRFQSVLLTNVYHEKQSRALAAQSVTDICNSLSNVDIDTRQLIELSSSQVTNTAQNWSVEFNQLDNPPEYFDNESSSGVASEISESIG